MSLSWHSSREGVRGFEIEIGGDVPYCRNLHFLPKNKYFRMLKVGNGVSVWKCE
jgi:hypothetical protein